MVVQRSVRSEVISQIEQVASERGKELAPLTDDLLLRDSGLDSLCFAVIAVRLEDALELDPFDLVSDHFPLTLGEFIKFYEDAAA